LVVFETEDVSKTDGGFSLGASSGSGIYNVYVWGRNLAGATIWYNYFGVSSK